MISLTNTKMSQQRWPENKRLMKELTLTRMTSMTARQIKMGMPECNCKSADYDCHRDDCKYYDTYGKLKPRKSVFDAAEASQEEMEEMLKAVSSLPHFTKVSGPCPIIEDDDEEDDGTGALSF